MFALDSRGTFSVAGSSTVYLRIFCSQFSVVPSCIIIKVLTCHHNADGIFAQTPISLLSYQNIRRRYIHTLIYMSKPKSVLHSQHEFMNCYTQLTKIFPTGIPFPSTHILIHLCAHLVEIGIALLNRQSEHSRDAEYWEP